jgi:hypothetical protein
MKISNAITALTLSTTLANAGGYTTYTDRNSFNADAGALSIETFESESLGDLALPTILDSGLGVAMPVGNVSSYVGAGNPDSFAFENTTFNGRNYLAFGRNVMVPGAPDMPQTGSYSVEYTFTGAVSAFGFDLSGAEFLFAAGGFNVTTYSNGQIADDFFFASDQLFSARFYGLVADQSFDAIRINLPVLGSNGTADYVAFDDVAWGVPTPSALSMLALGGLISTRRKR